MADLRPTDDDLRNFGDELLRLRERAGKSLSEVASEVYVTASFLSILEKKVNPKTKNPSRPARQLVLRLARALNATVDEGLRLARFAGYDLSDAGDHQAVARVLAGGRLPSVFQELLDLETDLGEYVEQVRLVEAPTFTLLGYLDKAGSEAQVCITGRAFRAWNEPPAQLYGMAAKIEVEPLRAQVAALRAGGPLTGPLRIGVLGQLMTPTVNLLRHLARTGATYKVHNNDRPDASFAGPLTGEGSGDPIELLVVYSDEALAELLKLETIDLALMVHPFRRVRDNKLFKKIDLDLWIKCRDAELPMSIVVTTPGSLASDERRTELVDRMDALRHTYRTMIGSRRRDARRDYVDYVNSDEESPVLEGFSELYLNDTDKEELAEELATFAAVGYSLKVLDDAKPSDFYKKFIKTRDELIPRDSAPPQADAPRAGL